uniref:Uncharacterized protein n=1 Tax=Ditylenchus dipsaci TaxID=166011 RepID=A0A915D2K5_9BILA
MDTPGYHHLLLVLCLVHSSLASFCGPAAIPFSFEALPSGQPVLGCARPTCFGWTAEGKPAASPATFYRVNKKPDGYFRKAAADARPSAVNSSDADSFRPQTAQCAATFEGEQCPSEYSWVGGIGPMVNVSALPLALQCCKYEPLKLSSDRGVAVVNPGQIVFGGEVLSGKRQYAFDYVSDVVKHNKADGSVSYDVSIRRLACLPYPSEMSIGVEEVVNEEIIRRFAKANKSDKSKAFQAPTQLASNAIVDNNIGVGGPDVAPQVGGTADRVVLQQVGESVQTVEGPFVAESNAEVPQGLLQPAAPPAQAAVPASDFGSGGYGSGGYGSGGYGSGGSGGYGSGGYGGGGSGGGGGGSGFLCFTADTLVRTANGANKRMDELKIGEWVLSANRTQLVYTVVESWIHRVPQQLAEFQKIEMDDGKVVKLTAKHFIYKTKCSGNSNIVPFSQVSLQPVYAEKVEVGDCLYVLQGSNFVERRVKGVSTVQEQGIYAPMTGNGDIVVDDVFASCYTILNSKVMQQTYFSSMQNLMSALWSGQQEKMDLPFGTSILASLMEHVLPKHIYSIL